jgi:Terminase large subunit, T4likevirus-type, N-terminal
VLGRAPYWSRQVEIAESVMKYRNTYVATGNAVGKSYLAAGLLLWYLTTRPNSLVIATAPTQTQLEQVLWKEVEKAYANSKIPLGGRMLKQPLSIDYGGGWKALAYSTKTTERFSGHHAEEVLVIVDEASGVEDGIYEAISSLNASRQLLIGNPLRPSGKFYDVCTHPNKLTNIIHIASTESPDIALERGRGLADAKWLEQCRADYGCPSLWWTCHVEGRFPDSGADSVFPLSWLHHAEDNEQPGYRRTGPSRMAIDLALGITTEDGMPMGDRSVIMLADHDSLLDCWHSRTSSLEATAEQARKMAQRWGVAAPDISFDVAGLGADFGHRLKLAGLDGATPYRGGASVESPKFANQRSASAWRARQRLDPDRAGQNRFRIPRGWLKDMWEELVGLRYELDLRDSIKLEVKEDFAKRLRKSPDLCDCFTQLWAGGLYNDPSTPPPAVFKQDPLFPTRKK